MMRQRVRSEGDAVSGANRLPHAFARAVARECLQELDLVQSIGHPGESGRAREGVLRRFLRRLCPPGMGLDTGFVIDGTGSISGQVDLVLYRNDYYPIFEIGGVKHFPVESVVAVFEIKASTDSESKLQGALRQIESVKALDRTGRGTNYALGVARGGPPRLIDPDVFQCQVFGVVLAERSVAVEAAAGVVENYCEAHPRRFWPNMVVAVRDYAVRYKAPDGDDSSEDPMHAVAVLASGSLDEGTPPLADVAVALANIVRVSVRSDYSPSNYFPDSKNYLVERTLEDDRFPGRRDSGPPLAEGK